jgi:hypothetical protein
MLKFIIAGDYLNLLRNSLKTGYFCVVSGPKIKVFRIVAQGVISARQEQPFRPLQES